jgi:hypothetical protein
MEQVVTAAHADAEQIVSAAARDEQVCLGEATQHAEVLLERAKADAAVGHAAVQVELERFARLCELVGEQIEHFGCPVQDELAEPTCDGAGDDPDGARVCGAAAAGPDSPETG